MQSIYNGNNDVRNGRFFVLYWQSKDFSLYFNFNLPSVDIPKEKVKNQEMGKYFRNRSNSIYINV